MQSNLPTFSMYVSEIWLYCSNQDGGIKLLSCWQLATERISSNANTNYGIYVDVIPSEVPNATEI